MRTCGDPNAMNPLPRPSIETASVIKRFLCLLTTCLGCCSRHPQRQAAHDVASCDQASSRVQSWSKRGKFKKPSFSRRDVLFIDCFEVRLMPNEPSGRVEANSGITGGKTLSRQVFRCELRSSLNMHMMDVLTTVNCPFSYERRK